jgi:hypothetical protein
MPVVMFFADTIKCIPNRIPASAGQLPQRPLWIQRSLLSSSNSFPLQATGVALLAQNANRWLQGKLETRRCTDKIADCGGQAPERQRCLRW